MTEVDSDVIARFFVAGRPRTKGHMKPMPHRRGNGKLAITVHDRDLVKAWIQTLIRGIREQAGIVPILSSPRGTRYSKVVGVEPPWPYAGPVLVDSTFYFERELSVIGQDPIPSHDTPYPTARGIGDRDTLERALLDALTQSGLLADDSLVVGGEPRKRWADDLFRPGVICTVRVAP